MFYIPIIVSLFTLIFTFFLIKKIKKAPTGTGEALKISQAIREGALSYLKRQYKAIGLAAIIIFFLLGLILGWKIAIGFLIGASASGVSGFIGMMVSTQANLRVAEAGKERIKERFVSIFSGRSGDRSFGWCSRTFFYFSFLSLDP